MGYERTFITVADDCPVTSSVVPQERAGKKTIAVRHYELINEQPYGRTQEDVLFEGLRASPLPKKFGWGLHYDEAGRIALYGVESETYRRFASGDEPEVEILKALRSKRA